MTQQDRKIVTGVMRVATQWPGIFLQGKDALSYARNIKVLLDVTELRVRAGGELIEPELSAWTRLSELADLLETCRVDLSGDGEQAPTAKEE